MPNNSTLADGMSDRQLALWMLEKMRGSEEFLGQLRQARVDGVPDMLDRADVVALHTGRLKKLHQGEDEEVVEVPASIAGTIVALVERDLLSGPEELLEKALAAYIERTNDRGLPRDWQPTIELARAEIEGRTSGKFHPGFVAGLAGAAREEMGRQAGREQDRGRERDD
jgi:hypothetical protein